MGGIDTKSLLIGLAVGYLILPKIIVAVSSKASKAS
jgi:hypothetical protein